MKKIDLSTRNVPRPASPIPSFSKRNHATGTVTATGASTQDIFNPQGAVTVQWVIAQVSAGGTFQLVENSEPIGAAMTVGAGTVIRFAGLLLPNNAKLSLLVSAACVVAFDVAWVKDFSPELVVSDTAVYGGALLQAATASDAPTGNETALVVRDIFRKKSQLLTTTPLAGAGVFTSAWFDSQLTGCDFVTVTAIANVNGVSVVIQESEDQVNTRSAGSQAAGTTTYRTSAFIRSRYWRIVYTNAAGAQASFSVYATETSVPFTGTALSTNTPEFVPVGFGIALVTQNDGVGANVAPINTLSGTSGPITVVPMEFNGATLDKQRGTVNTTTGDTGTKTVTFSGAAQTNFDSVSAYISILLGVVSGTTPTLSAQLQWSPDGGTTWKNLGAALPNLTLSNQVGTIVVCPALLTGLTLGADASVLIAAPLPRTWRISYTIAGTTPSFAISSVQVNYTK